MPLPCRRRLLHAGNYAVPLDHSRVRDRPCRTGRAAGLRGVLAEPRSRGLTGRQQPVKCGRLLSACCTAPFARACRLAGGRRPACSTLPAARLLSVPRAFLDVAARTLTGDGGIAAGRDDEPVLDPTDPAGCAPGRRSRGAVPAAAASSVACRFRARERCFLVYRDLFCAAGGARRIQVSRTPILVQTLTGPDHFA